MTKAEARRLKLAKDLEEVHLLADAILARAKRPPKRVGGQPTREEAREAKRKAAAARTANVRVEVWKRDEGKCVVCGVAATEMHHLVYGSGYRRVLETGQTCAALCALHHRQAHAGHLEVLYELRSWAFLRLYGLAWKALDRRIAKIEARPKHGRTTP